MITCPNGGDPNPQRGRTLLRLHRREEARDEPAGACVLAEDLAAEPIGVDTLLEGAPTL